MKKLLALVGVLGAGAAFAEGEAGSNPISTNLGTLSSDVTSNVTTIGNQLGTWVSEFTPVLLGIAGVFVAIWLIRIAIRAVKSVASASK